MNNPCWKGYKALGTKEKDGHTVPNCVPIDHSELQIPDGWTVQHAEKKYYKTVKNPETGRTKKVGYGAKGYRIAPGTSKGDSYCARSEGDRKSVGYDCSGKDKNTPLCLSRAKWKCSGSKSRRD